MTHFEEAIELLEEVRDLLLQDVDETSDGELIDQLFALKIGKFLDRMHNIYEENT